jgi:hypothetical protein
MHAVETCKDAVWMQAGCGTAMMQAGVTAGDYCQFRCSACRIGQGKQWIFGSKQGCRLIDIAREWKNDGCSTRPACPDGLLVCW